MDRPLLFKAYPVLRGRIPWVKLGDLPTPVERLSRLGDRLGCSSLWVKRDDLSSEKMGGNKVRVMEFLLGRMKAEEKTVAISPGALGSNQILASAIYGHELGLKIVGVFFKQCPTDYMCKHMLIDQSLGVEFNHVNSPYLVPLAIVYHYLRHVDWRRMQSPFYIPTFGSSATCALGYLDAMFELKEQIDGGGLPEPDYIFVTAGTGGTMAGLELGARLLRMKTKVMGVRITDWVACNERVVASIVNRACKLLASAGADLGPFRWKARHINLIHEFFGGEYARITPEGLAARQLAAQLEGLTLDTTYTAKTMAAMIKYITDRRLRNHHILFWHTYNTRDLSPFLSQNACPEKLPPAFQPYFTAKTS